MTDDARFNCLTFDEAVEAIRYEDSMTGTGVGAIVRLALGDEDADMLVGNADQLGYREFNILARIFASFGRTIVAAEYDQLLEAINTGHEPEEEEAEA